MVLDDPGNAIGAGGIVIGFITSLYFARKAREQVEIRFFVRSQLLLDLTRVSPNLILTYRGETIPRVYRCLVAIWNSGRKTALADMLTHRDPLTISLLDVGSIVSADVAVASRDVNGINAKVIDHAIQITFDFLDRTDGAIIEILYNADTESNAAVSGTIQGMPSGPVDIGRVSVIKASVAPLLQLPRRRRWRRPVAVAFGLTLTLAAIALAPVSATASARIVGALTLGCMLFFIWEVWAEGVIPSIRMGSIPRALKAPMLTEPFGQQPTARKDAIRNGLRAIKTFALGQ